MDPREIGQKDWEIMQQAQRDREEKDFKFATSVMKITNEILEPLNLPIRQRQLENDRVDKIIADGIRKMFNIR